MRFIVLSLSVWLFLVSCSGNPAGLGEGQIVFQSVNVIPMDEEKVLSNQVVVVKDGRIEAIGEAGKVNYGKKALVIDGQGKYLMPGLAEMHAHVPTGDDMQPMKDVLKLFAFHGVTTIRGMLGHPRHLELRKMVDSGEIIGPRFFTSGPALAGWSIPTPAAGDSAVRAQKAAGYDFMKILPGLSREAFDAIEKAAKEVNIRYAGHVPFQVGIWRAIDADYATIDHLDGFIEGLIPANRFPKEQEAGLFGMNVGDRVDLSQLPRLIGELKAHNVWVVPTQALAERWFTSERTAESFRNDPEMKYMSPETLDNWVKAKNSLSSGEKFDSARMTAYVNLRKKLIKECYDNGVGMLLGCDAPQIFNVPGVATHHELRYLVDAGLTPYQALRTGTVNVGKFYGRDDMGVVREGALSDILLLGANPLDNITNSTRIEGVLLRGQWMPASSITEQLKLLEK